MTRLPIVTALAIQAVALALTVALAWCTSGVVTMSPWGWLALHVVLASGGALWMGMRWWWAPIQALLPLAVVWQSAAALPAGAYLFGFVVLLLAFGGGLFVQVPLYNSNRAAWRELLALLPSRPGLRFVDLGAGLAGPLAYLARQRPDAIFVGVEASPLVWFVAWLRTLPVRRNCRLRLGSLWSEDLSQADVVYVFLSPTPMPALWAKAQREMPSGALLVSNTFAIPDVPPARTIDLPGRADARLLVWVISR